MSIDNSSLAFRYNFTDGTFMTVINVSINAPEISGENTIVLPNHYFGDLPGGLSGTMIKYDKNGNKFEFSDQGVIINDTQDFRRTGNRMAFIYNTDTDTLGVGYFTPPPEFIPSISESDRAVRGFCFNGDVSGSPFSSLGEAIAKGEEFYDTLSYGWYSICNILPRTNGTPFYSANLFSGSRQGGFFINAFPNTSGTYSPVSIDVDGTMDDFDPVNPIDPSEDPYDPEGGGTEPGGGGGDHDDGSDDIDIPTLPTLSAVETGFISLYRPSAQDLINLANYLWSSPLAIWDNLKKIVQQPMDCILGLSIVPVNPSVGAAKPITIADVNTGVTTYPVTSQYVEVDCGSITVSEYWGAYLDYEPYTKAEIYLPYIGTHPISIDDIMGKTVTIKYHVDVLSGACTAYVKCGSSVLYSFIGQCASSIPIGGNDWTNVITGALTIATAIGSMVASGGASAPMSGSATPEQIAHAESMHRAAMIREVGGVASTAVNVLKPSIGKSGSMSGTGGLMAIQKPYLILTRPRQAVPGSQNHYMGYPSFITTSIGSLSGYTEVEEVHLDGIPGTDNELAEIESLLRGGVYL